jgi:hypothetical protein
MLWVSWVARLLKSVLKMFKEYCRMKHGPREMSGFNIPEWAVAQGRSDPFQLVLDGGTNCKTAAALTSHDYVLVTQGASMPLARDASNVLFIADASVAKGHAAFVRHNKNGSIYCIDLGAEGGTFINSIRCPAHKPVKVSPGSAIKFGCCAQSYAVAGIEGTKAAGPCTATVCDKENAWPQAAAKHQVAQREHLPAKQYANSPLRSLPCAQITSERIAQAKCLQSLLPPSSRRQAAAAQRLELPKSIKAMLQVNGTVLRL